MRRILPVLLVLACLGIAAPAVAAGADQCGPNTVMAAQATYVEENPTTKTGRRPDYAYHYVSAITKDGQVSGGQIVPVHYGGIHALESAYSPHNTEDQLYWADMAILHWVSGGDCTGPDDYAYSATVGCADSPDYTIAEFEKVPCHFDAWVGLQVMKGSTSNTWAASWGYSHRHNSSGRKTCYAEGGKHGISDNYGWVRTWVYLDGDFVSPYRLFNARKSTSLEMFIGSAPDHVYDHGPCWPDWCDATTPPNNNAAVAFNSCTT